MERSLTAKRVSTVRKVGWLSVASMLALALLAPAANAEGNPPTTECAGYDYYFKIDQGAGVISEQTYAAGDTDVVTNWPDQEITISNIGGGGQTFDWASTEGVSLVVTKEGSNDVTTPYDPPAFSGSVADETQLGLSHITFCGDEPAEETEPPVTEPPVTEPPVTEPPVTEPPVTEPPVTEPPVTEPPVTEPPTPSQSVLSETGTPSVTLPPTDSIGGTSAPSDGTWRLALIALAALLASVLVMTPARATSRRR